MAESIVGSPDPGVPPGLEAELTPHFATFFAATLAKDPSHRLPADVLLGADWFLAWGIATLEDAQAIVAEYLAAVPV